MKLKMTEEPEDFEGRWPDMDRACDAFEAADCPGDRGRGNLEFKLRAALAVLYPPVAELQRLIDAAKSVCDSAVAHDWVTGKHTKCSAVSLDCLRAALDALEGM